jgi:outer membrane cobalamin receptor
VWGTRLDDARDAISARLDVLDRATIERLGLQSLADALQLFGGVSTDSSGAGGRRGSVYLRAADPNHTAIFIDGVRVNDPTNARGGSVDLNAIALASIERIEVVRGPLSPIHGSDAMAGAIYITTRGMGEPHDAALELSSDIDESHGGAVQMRAESGRVTARVSSFARRVVDPDGRGRRQGRGLNVQFETTRDSAVEASLNLRYTHDDLAGFPDDSGGDRYAVIRTLESRLHQDWSAGAALRWTPSGQNIVQLQASWFGLREDVESPGVAPGARDPFGIPPQSGWNRFERYTAQGYWQHRASADLELLAGLEATHEAARNRDVLRFGDAVATSSYDDARVVLAPFAEARYSPAASLGLQLQLRGDWIDGEQWRASPRLAASYRLSDAATVVQIAWGRAFKSPSFFALGNAIVGNPTLKSESSETAELRLLHAGFDDRWSGRWSAFRTRYEDLIDFDPGPPPRLVNRSAVTVTGAEAELALALSEGYRLHAHVSYADADVHGNTQPLRNRPEWTGGIVLDTRIRHDLTFALTVQATGKALDSSIPTGDRWLGSYARADLSLLWTPAPAVQIAFTLSNATGSDYEQSIGQPTSELQPSFTARWFL